MSMNANNNGKEELEKCIAESHAAYAAGFEHAEKNEVGAMYIRSSVQDEDRIVYQLQQTLAFVARESIWVAFDHVYCDRSPVTEDARPGLAALQQLLERGPAKVVIVFTLNRFFRNQTRLDKFVEYYQSQHGVRFLEVQSQDSAVIAKRRAWVEDEKVTIVREIFGMFSNGMTIEEVVAMLNTRY